MFAQILITLATIVLAAWLLWRWVARPLIDALFPIVEGEPAPEEGREVELEEKLRERERLAREVELAREIRRIDPQLDRLKEKLRSLDESEARPDVAHPRREEE
jgi:hypothetical protein